MFFQIHFFFKKKSLKVERSMEAEVYQQGPRESVML